MTILPPRFAKLWDSAGAQTVLVTGISKRPAPVGSPPKAHGPAKKSAEPELVPLRACGTLAPASRWRYNVQGSPGSHSAAQFNRA